MARPSPTPCRVCYRTPRRPRRVPFGVHGARGGKKALPKKEDVVFHVMQMGWQGACELCAGPPSGPLSWSLGTFSGLCSLGSAAAAPHRPAANQGKSSDKPDSILAALPSVGVIKRGTFPVRLGTSLAVAAGTVVPPQRAAGRPGRSETHAKALWGTLKGIRKRQSSRRRRLRQGLDRLPARTAARKAIRDAT